MFRYSRIRQPLIWHMADANPTSKSEDYWPTIAGTVASQSNEIHSNSDCEMETKYFLRRSGETEWRHWEEIQLNSVIALPHYTSSIGHWKHCAHLWGNEQISRWATGITMGRRGCKLHVSIDAAVMARPRANNDGNNTIGHGQSGASISQFDDMQIKPKVKPVLRNEQSIDPLL